MTFTRVMFWLSLLLPIYAGGRDLPLRHKVLEEANRLLNLATISYVWGGKVVSEDQSCEVCSRCIATHKPDSRSAIKFCPSCSSCSLDCSHFIHLVFKNSGLTANYLTTLDMQSLSPKTLKRNGWQRVGNRAVRAIPGDLLVYPRHVALVEKVTRSGFGQVVHATSGTDLRGARQGIQRQTRVDFQSLRGPLQLVLRHNQLIEELRQSNVKRRGLRTKL